MRQHVIRITLLFALVLAHLAAVPAAAGANASNTTADHSKFKALAGPFASGPEVTRACIKCHTEAAQQVMKTRHWTWDYTHPLTGQRLGKKTILNGFCIGDQSNEPFCQSCHIGYGWKDASFDFSDANKVDCLAGRNADGYAKPAGFAGNPVTQRTEYPPGSGTFVERINLATVAQNTGRTSRAICGACHWGWSAAGLLNAEGKPFKTKDHTGRLGRSRGGSGNDNPHRRQSLT